MGKMSFILGVSEPNSPMPNGAIRPNIDWATLSCIRGNTLPTRAQASLG
jgi:hypothetical protein